MIMQKSGRNHSLDEETVVNNAKIRPESRMGRRNAQQFRQYFSEVLQKMENGQKLH